MTQQDALAPPHLHVGLVGAGGIAGAHLAAWRQLGVRVSIFSDDGQAEVLAAGDDTGRITALRSLAELLDRCEAVDVCTPTFTHRDIVVAATEAAKPVICEKPLALTVADAAVMIGAARAAGVDLFPAHVVRYFPEYEAMVAAVAGGVVGVPAVLRFTRSGAYPTRSGWFSDPARSGGVLMDQMIHDLDMARLVAGEVVAVHAVVRSEASTPARPGDVAAATAVLTHDGGAISHVRGVWGPPSTPFQTSFRIAGPGGVLTHDSLDTHAFRVVACNDTAPAPPGVVGAPSPYQAELAEFALAFAGGPRPRVSAHDGLVAIAIANAAQRSADTGTVATLELPAPGTLGGVEGVEAIR